MGAPLRPRGSWRRSSAASLGEGEGTKEGGRVENRQLTQPLLLLVVVTATASTASSCLFPTCIAASSLLTTAAAVTPTSRGPPDPTAATGINVGSDNATDAAEEPPEPEGAAAVARSDYSPSAAAAATASVGRGRWGRSAVSGDGRAAAVGPPRATAAAASATLATPHYYFFHGLPVPSPPPPLATVLSCGLPHALTASIRPQRPTQNGEESKSRRRRRCRRCRKHHVVRGRRRHADDEGGRARSPHARVSGESPRRSPMEEFAGEAEEGETASAWRRPAEEPDCGEDCVDLEGNGNPVYKVFPSRMVVQVM